jgi:hypothetical protein
MNVSFCNFVLTGMDVRMAKRISIENKWIMNEIAFLFIEINYELVSRVAQQFHAPLSVSINYSPWLRHF